MLHTHTEPSQLDIPYPVLCWHPLVGDFVQPKNTQGCTSQFSCNTPHLVILALIYHDFLIFPKELIDRTKKVLRPSLSFIPRLQHNYFYKQYEQISLNTFADFQIL